MNQEIGKKLLSILKVEQVKKDEPMKIHTTFRVGGPASYFVTPETEEEVAKVIEVCTQENVPYYIVGNGSNLLVSDQGYEGVIIQIYKHWVKPYPISTTWSSVSNNYVKPLRRMLPDG